MQSRSRFVLFTLAGATLAAALSEGCGSSGGSSSTNHGGSSSSGQTTASTGTGGTGGTGSTGTGGAITATGTGGAISTTGTGGATTTTGTGGTGSTGTGGATTATGTGGGVLVHPIVPCQNHVYECGDGIDNDGDGLVDSDDPDCLGPCDNTENSYFPGIPGLTGPKCSLDCFFDQDSGAGNDDCYWTHKCDGCRSRPACLILRET